MKISKLFHWLYAILMLLPFGLVLFNMLHGLFSPSVTVLIDWNTFIGMFDWLDSVVGNDGISATIYNTYNYLLADLFGFNDVGIGVLQGLLTYWTCISIIWLVFDVFMYVPLLVHRWIDKAKLE